MRQLEQSWDQHNVAIAVVTFEPNHIAQAYLDDTKLPWPVLVDDQRSLYGAYEMDRAPRRAIWSLSSMAAYVRLVRGGRRVQRATGDVRQRGGDVLIDPQQRVRLHHVGHGPADRPSPKSLLAAITT